MKKVVLPLLIMLLLAGCGTSKSSFSTYTDDNGHFVYETDRGKDVHVSEIPYEVPYNTKTFTLSGVEFYENKTDYSYNLFVVITLDIEDLSDDEAHWLAAEDLEVNAYITSEKNELDFDSLSSLGNIRWTDDKTIQFVKMSSTFHSYRYSFAESKISVVVGATQEETYDYKNSEGKVSQLHKNEQITYSTTTPSSITDAEEIPEPLYDYVAKWLYENAAQ